MPTHAEVIEELCRQRDEARFLARHLAAQYRHLRHEYLVDLGVCSAGRRLHDDLDAALAKLYPWLETEQAAALPARLPFVQPAREE